MKKFIVHGIAPSPYVQAVRIALAEKGEEATLQPPGPGGLKAEPHLARHPFGMMPVLEHDGFELYETQAILRYLDRLIPAPALTPADIRHAARMDQVMNIADHYLMGHANRVIGFHRIVGPMLFGLQPDLAAIEAAMPRARTVFKVLDGLLANRPYFAGNAISLADILAIPHVAMLSQTPEWQELAAPNAHLVGWQQRMFSRATVSATLLPQPELRVA